MLTVLGSFIPLLPLYAQLGKPGAPTGRGCFPGESMRKGGKGVTETNQPHNDRPFGTWHLHSWQYVPERAKERHPVHRQADPTKACPPSSMPASGLGLLLPICSGEGLYFLGDLGRSRIKKYFLFKYEAGKTCLKKLDLLIRSMV